MPDRERIQKLASLLMERGGKDALNQMRCGGKKYPDGGKFFRTNLEQESPLMYQPMMPVYPDVQAPLRYYPQPNLGDYEYPTSTGMVQSMPIQRAVPVAVSQTGVLAEEALPAPVEEPVIDLFSDEAIARRALKQRWAESSFNDKAVSKAGAMGAWQIMPITLKDYMGRGRGKSGDLNDPVYNRQVRDWVMSIIPRDLQEFWSEDDSDRSKLAKLYAAYNWGAGNLRSFLRKKQNAGVDISNPDNWVDDLNPETRRYVKYLAFDEDIPDSTAYTNAAFEKAAMDRGYFAGGGRLFRDGGPEKSSLITKAVRRYLFGNKADDEVRKALYDNLYPYGYGEVDMFESLARTKSAASGERDPRWAIYDGDGTIDELGVDDGRYYGGRDDIFATYLGIPEKDRHKNFRDRLAKVSESEYHPTKGNEDNKYYRISITDDDKDDLIYSGLKTPIGESMVSSSLGHYFGDHTVSHGLDKKGEYISYYDNWDINPLYGRHRVNKEKNVHLGYLPTISKMDLRYDGETFLEGLLNGDIKYYRSNTPIDINIPNPFVSQKGDNGDMSIGIGKPVNFYDRIYLDDYYGVDSRTQNPDEFYGGYILPSIVSSEKASGGKIHIKPENRGKFTALKKRTGHSASWFKAHGTPAQKKMAVFALNARKWHHGDGGFINQYDGESEETGWLRRLMSTPVKVPNMTGTATAAATGLRDIPLVDSTVGKELAVAGTAMLPLTPYLGTQTALGIDTMGRYAMPSTFLKGVSYYAPKAAGALGAVSPWLDAGALSLWSTQGVKAAREVRREGRIGDAVGLGTLSALPIVMPLGMKMYQGLKNVPKISASEIVIPEKTVIQSQALSTPYEIEDLGGGYMLKSLMRGNPLEKQISKQGTVSVNNVKALAGKGSKVEQAIVDKVLASDEFSGKKSIDYNKFRKAVQGELITYDRTPDTRWQDYGMQRIGLSPYDSELESDYEYYKLFDKFIKEKGYTPIYNQAGLDSVVYETPDGKYIGEKELEDIFRNSFNAKAETFTFSSSRIPRGSDKHYDANTLGHSRTYTTADEPDVLHVMESQSDWAQGKSPILRSSTGGYQRNYDGTIDVIYDNVSGRYRRTDPWETGFPEHEFFHEIGPDGLTHASRFHEQQRSEFPLEQAEYLKDNFTSRQIQENLRYAAEKGQKKMRYPTRETAAKIEGYPEVEMYIDEHGIKHDTPYEYDQDIKTKLDAVQRRFDEISRSNNESDMPEYERLAKKLGELSDAYTNSAVPIKNAKKVVSYANEHEGILKKYDAFPKQYKKLYKNVDVRIVTDSKGNTWYEVDVPENYLKQEWKYSTGGILERYKPNDIKLALSKVRAGRK